MPYKGRKRGILIKSCAACNKNYNVEPSRFSTSRFCSVKCARLILAPLRKGAILSQEQKDKISKTLTGRYLGENSFHWKGGNISLFCGRCSFLIDIQKWRIGRSKNIYCSLKCKWLSVYTWNSGIKNNKWRGGVTPGNEKIRKSLAYKEWRNQIFSRDNFTCQLCGIRGVTIHADHIKPFCKYKELRFSVPNGRTLCVPCHRKTDTWGSKALAA